VLGVPSGKWNLRWTACFLLVVTGACGRIGYDPLQDELGMIGRPGGGGSGGDSQTGSGGTTGSATGGALTSDGSVVGRGGTGTGGGTSTELDGGASPDRDAARDASSRDAAPDGTVGAVPDAAVNGGSLAVGLVGYWKFEEVDLLGALTPDSSGNGNVGTLESFSPTDWQAGFQGRGIEFGAAWVKSAFTSSFDMIQTEVSVSAWIQARGVGPGTGTVLQRQVGKTTQAHFSLRLEKGHVQFAGAAFGICETPSSTVTNGKWVHVAGTFDGATVNVYVDGALGATCPATALFLPDTTPITIGAALSTSATTQVVDPFTSLMDEVALFRRALPAVEVRALASGSVPLP
jgi:hypothetical protein